MVAKRRRDYFKHVEGQLSFEDLLKLAEKRRENTTVNRYGAMARSHWARWLPQQYATISDPDSFFSEIGQEAARQIDELTTELAGDGQPGEDYLARAGRLTAARSQAEEIVLPQQVLPPPEPGPARTRRRTTRRRRARSGPW